MRDHRLDPGRVLILMATCNSGRFLDEQLSSIAEQSWPRIDLLVSDDMSTDGTIHLLRRWQHRWRKGRFDIMSGPGAGFAENFRSLILAAGDDVAYVSFCDQDDIWLSDRVESGILALAPHRGVPGLYCSPTTLIDQTGREIGASPQFRRQPSFQNALVQNIASGNTMTLNQMALVLLQKAAARTSFPFHDWFAYQILTGAGGNIVYGTAPKVRYRQHGGNAVGVRLGAGAWTGRVQRLSAGLTREWANANMAALAACIDLLTPEARNSLGRFAESRSGSMLKRLQRLKLSGVYRQSPLDQVLLYLTSIAGRT